MDKKPRVSIIVAIAKDPGALNGGGYAMGRNNDLLWRISDDLKRFKSITLGHPIIMGKNTFESIGRVLPGRLNIIVAREKNYKVQGASVVNSIDDAIELGKENDNEEIFFIGGGQIFGQVLDKVHRLYLTLVDSDAKGDVFFPEYDDFKKVVFKQDREHEGLKYTWVTLER